MFDTNSVIYQVFVRNYSQDGTFVYLEKDLKRIKDLGVDIIYLTPINEIGQKNRKGNWGSPYASKDYFSISPDLGSKEDLISLINKTHSLGMKIILDMVFNHTAPDSVLFKKHPEFYFYKDGKPGNRIGDWSDIIDLDTSREDTQDYLIEVLRYWSNLGFDGFRFDVASLIDINVFKKARQALPKDTIFLAESVSPDFYNFVKSRGMIANSDEELSQYFDVLYNYNYYHDFEHCLKGEESFEVLVNKINEDSITRTNCLENHDRDRVASLIKGNRLMDLLDFSINLKGCPFIYMGQEYLISHKPDLFEKDPVIWKVNQESIEFIKAKIKEKKARHIFSQKLILVGPRSIKLTQCDEKGNIIFQKIYQF